MLITFRSKGRNGNPEANCTKEMSLEEFAHAFATAAEQNPGLDSDSKTGKFPCTARVFAHIFGLEVAKFHENDLRDYEGIDHSPEAVNVRRMCDDKLVMVLVDGRCVFFRRTENGLTLLQFAKDCWIAPSEKGLIAKTPFGEYRANAPEFPWVAFYPEKLAGTRKFESILTPDEENPLTGILSSRDGAVRILGNQLVSRLREMRELWIAEVVASL